MATRLSPGSAFLAGLLHDSGRAVFHKLAPNLYKEVSGNSALLPTEVSLFGCDHAVAGGWLAETTGLPRDQMLAVRYHHAPALAPEFKDLAAAVSLSEALASRLSPGDENDGVWTKEHDEILLEFSISADDITEISYRLRAEEPEIMRFLEL